MRETEMFSYVHKGPKGLQVGDPDGEDLSGGEAVQQSGLGQLLGPPPGENGTEMALPFLQGLHGEAHRAPHPGEDGDVPGGAVGNAQGGFRPGHVAPKGAHVYPEAVLRAAQDGGALQNHLLLHGPPEGGGGGAQRLVVWCIKQVPFGPIALRQSD